MYVHSLVPRVSFMRNYLLHMITFEPCKTKRRESLVCNVAIIFFKTGLTNIVGERNRKSVYEGYTDMYSATLGSWLRCSFL